ncbi:MAG: hypothetical protein ABUT20_21955 [Bacteroidota bacterium]
MERKVLKVRTGNTDMEVEYWQLGKDAYLVEQKVLLLFVNTKLGMGLTVLPVKSEKITYDIAVLADIKKAFTTLRENVK